MLFGAFREELTDILERENRLISKKFEQLCKENFEECREVLIRELQTDLHDIIGEIRVRLDLLERDVLETLGGKGSTFRHVPRGPMP